MGLGGWLAGTILLLVQTTWHWGYMRYYLANAFLESCLPLRPSQRLIGVGVQVSGCILWF